MPTIAIRDARAADAAVIADLIERAFGQRDEARLVERLGSDGDVALSLVAVESEAIVGHVLLSRMAQPQNFLGLAPLSVLPSHQRLGIGGQLIHAAVARAREQGASGIFVLGDPSYYPRFGFRADAAKAFASPYAGPYFMLLPLADLPPHNGIAEYAPAFAAFE